MHPFFIILTLSILILSGCATRQPAPPIASSEVASPGASWVNHVKRNTLLREWQVKGKIGIRTKNDGGSAYLDWNQSFDSFHIRLSGPLGQGSTIITGNPHGARLQNKNGEYLSESPEQLVLEHTGWNLPIHNLLYWIKGIPAPHETPQITYNEDGLMQSLQQGKWHLDFSRYQPALNCVLPQRIKIQNDDLNVTLIIKEWLPLPQPNQRTSQANQ